MVDTKKVVKTLCKDKKLKELYKAGQDVVAVFGARLFNVTPAECTNADDEKAALRYNAALVLANSIATKNSGYLIETNIAEMLKKLFEVKIEVPVEAPKKATTKKPATKKTTTKKASK